MLSEILLVVLCTAVKADFVRNPESVTVTEGDNVTFTCQGNNYDSGSLCPNYIYYWKRTTPSGSEQYLTNCNSLDESNPTDRMTVTKADGLYTLNIQEVRPEDSGDYYCYIYYSDFFGTYQYTSDKAFLTVNAPPRHPPSCEVLPAEPSIGMTVELRCQLSSQDPPSRLTWFESKSGQVVPPAPTGLTDPGEYFTVNLEITETDNYKEFTCVAGQELTTGPRCTTTPLQVPTVVSIVPSPLLTVSEGEMASFRCDSQSIPAAEEYRWRLRTGRDPVIKVNLNTLPSLGDTYRLSSDGQDLQITEVTVAMFNNTKVRCIAFNTLGSGSSGQSLLIVVPLETTTEQNQTSTASNKGGTDTTSGGTSTGIVVGGVIGVILLSVLIACLGFYIARNRQKPHFVQARFQNSPGHEGVGMAVVQASPTYEELPQDIRDQRSQLDRSWSVEDTGNAHSHLYANPEEARREKARSDVPSSPTYANSSGYANLPRGYSEERRVSCADSPYAVPDKREKSRPGPVGAEAAEVEPMDDRKQKNVEGLVYADLDLQRPQATGEQGELPDNDPINYASIRGDLTEIRGLLSRK